VRATDDAIRITPIDVVVAQEMDKFPLDLVIVLTSNEPRKNQRFKTADPSLGAGDPTATLGPPIL